MPVLAWLLLLAGCAEPPAPASPCLLPAEQHMLVAELFFGRNIKGRQPLTDAEWAEFAVQTITPNFPDGFTVFDGEGQWRNPQTGRDGDDFLTWDARQGKSRSEKGARRALDKVPGGAARPSFLR